MKKPEDPPRARANGAPEYPSLHEVQPRARLRGVDLPVLALLIVAPIAVLLFSQKQIIDDAYITYRHSHHFVHGNGLVFNAGERVEGFTNLLWTLLMVLPIWAGVSVWKAAAVLGLVFGLGAMVGAWRVSRDAGAGRWSAAAGALAVGMYPAYWLTAINGLEAGLYAFLLVIFVGGLVGGRRGWMTGVVGGLLFMTRPESLFLLPLVGGWMLVYFGREEGPRDAARRAGPVFAAWLGVIGAVTLWRLGYYGALLPNSVTAKSVPLEWAVVSANLRGGREYLWAWAVGAPVLAAGAVLACVGVLKSRGAGLCVLVVGGAAAVAWWHGGDWMPHARLMAAYAPLMGVALALGLQSVARLCARLPRPAGRAGAAAAGVLVLGGLAAGAAQHDWLRRPTMNVELPALLNREVALAIKPAIDPETRLCAEALGQFAYALPDHFVHDFFGLTDRHIAQRGTDRSWFGRTDYRYTIDEVRPDVILLHSGFYHWSRMREASTRDIRPEYVGYVLSGEPGPRSVFFLVLVRAELADRVGPRLRRFAPRPVELP